MSKIAKPKLYVYFSSENVILLPGRTKIGLPLLRVQINCILL
jgi:hypothetical protein